MVGPFGLFSFCGGEGVGDEGVLSGGGVDVDVPGAEHFGFAVGGGASAVEVAAAEVIEDEGILVDDEFFAEGSAGVVFVGDGDEEGAEAVAEVAPHG